MDSGDLSPQLFQTDSLGICAALQETGANRSLINEADGRSFYTEHNASNTPSRPQKAALRLLLQLEAQVVLAWLTILRSSQPGEFQTNLSSHQVAALRELKDCPHSLVEVWLQDAHRLAGPDAPQVPQEDSSHQATCLSALNDIYNTTTDTTTRNSTLSGNSSSFYGYSTGYSTPMSSYAPTSSYPNSLNEISLDGPRSSPLASAGHPHGCHICQKERGFGTCDGWKRHMKEHETLYPCNLCTAPGKVRSYSRRINLMRHLKTHGLSNNSNSKLADEWKKTHEKKFFGCGFCVFLCNSLTEQLSHIDSEHFRNFRSISEWDTNKVIRGLLLQPDLSLIVQNLLSQPFGTSENLSWHPSTVHELQLRLQESNESLENLARITVLQIDWDLTARNRDELNPASTFGYTCQDASAPTSSHHQMDLSTLSNSQSNHGYIEGTTQSWLPTWKSTAPRNIDECLEESVSDANEISGNGVSQFAPFAVPINVNSALSSTNPSYQHPVPSSVPRAAAPSEGLLPTTFPSGPIVARVLSLDDQLKKQRSRKKLMSHFGAPDIDFEGIQYLMREHGHSRSIKRQR